MSKQKIIDFPVSGVRDYVGLFNGIFSLTPTELDVLAHFVELHLQLTHGGFQTNAFSTDGRRIVAGRMGREHHTFLGSYIKTLKEKGVLTEIPGGYHIDPRLIPQRGETEIVFRIKP